MLALYELPGGYAVFRVIEGGGYKLVAQHLFKDSAEAVDAAKSLMAGELHGTLKKFLKKSLVDKSIKDTLAVQDAKLGGAIKKKLEIPCVHDDKVDEILRGIRQQVTELIEGLSPENLNQMSLGLAHTLNRHVLKFNPEKIDVMVIQAIGLLDDLDKELNTYAMRVKEWYGWHFPEMQKIVTDNLQYARVILKMGVRENACNTELEDVVSEDVAAQVKDAAIHSMGVGLTEEDISNIKQLCEEVLATSEYRTQLYDYLRNRMNAIAPNLTTMVGELVGARLISHAGSLMSLAKAPASTVQILGAEKALFRALKTKQKTPKYGLIYHASVVGQASSANKGKVARIAACQAALASRVDALQEGTTGPSIGVEGREQVEFKLRKLEGIKGAPLETTAGGPEAYSKQAQQATRPPVETQNPFRLTEDSKKRKADDAELSKEEKKAAKKAKLAAEVAAASGGKEMTKEEKKALKKKLKAEAKA